MIEFTCGIRARLFKFYDSPLLIIFPNFMNPNFKENYKRIMNYGN